MMVNEEEQRRLVAAPVCVCVCEDQSEAGAFNHHPSALLASPPPVSLAAPLQKRCIYQTVVAAGVRA